VLASSAAMTTHSSRRRHLRHVARAATAMFVAVALAGCIKMDVDLTLDGETADGSMIMAVEKSFLELAQVPPEDFLDELGAGDDFPEGSTVEPWEDDQYIGQRAVFSGIDLSEFDDPEFVSITYDADAGTYEVTGAMDMSDLGENEAELADLPDSMVEAMMGAFDLSISITFPGEVVEHNGELSGNTVTWTPTIGEVNEIRAVASESGSSGASTALLIGIGIAVLVLLAGLAFFLSRRNRGSAESEPTQEAAGV
jgi:hypothetical protein